MVTNVSGLEGLGSLNPVSRLSANPVQDGGIFAALARSGASAVETIKSAEVHSIAALTGEADVREVASAVMAAEQTLQLSMSVRDKIVSAFLELSRMQI